ncbi:MAG: ADP-ribosyl-[dinitrogen reductase] hydrolase [Rhodocyclaceae bacterium]|nr:ADP-ribosyl-[dinitrogen reductase] hydrolase [Rhodocyclaceae bacterium]MDZ4213172.1 ADP-ribosyl-[dinitrogen reductase] hydrolase [Rhodocyclaceae bacterium]
MSNTHRSDLIARAEASYLGLAIGDALGATVEFMMPREIRAAFMPKRGVHRELIGGGWLRLKPGQVTDDTTMALALGAAILADAGEVKPLSCAQAFDGWMRSKPVDIGNTVRRNLITFRNTGDPCAPRSEHDAGNGAAMRVLPVALATLGREESVVRAAIHAQAHVTHHNPASDAVCELLVFMVQDALRGASLRELYRGRIQPFVSAHPEFSFRPKRRENPSGWVVETLQAVLQALLDTGSFEDCLIDVVNRGGDADTTGAIAGMVAGALYGYESLPLRWLRALDAQTAKRVSHQAQALVVL